MTILDREPTFWQDEQVSPWLISGRKLGEKAIAGLVTVDPVKEHFFTFNIDTPELRKVHQGFLDVLHSAGVEFEEDVAHGLANSLDRMVQIGAVFEGGKVVDETIFGYNYHLRPNDAV